MSFKNILDSIVPVPSKIVRPKMKYEVGRPGTKVQWQRSTVDPIGGYGQEYQQVYCREHRQREFVPSGSYHIGKLDKWYKAGLHPRWSIWGEITKRCPNFAMSWFGTVYREEWVNSKASLATRRKKNWHPIYRSETLCRDLRKYKDDPDGFVKKFRERYYPIAIVRFRAGGRWWTEQRAFRDRYRKADFTLDEFKAEQNQTRRRLMLLSRSFKIEDVVASMTLLHEDAEGQVLQDGTGWRRGLFLHVQCATTGSHYLLGIPGRVKCTHGYTRVVTGGDAAVIHPEGHRCWAVNEEPWTAAEARRWTFGLDPSAEFVAEA